MNLLNHVIVGLLVLSSVTLTACQKEVPKTEEIPYVMVAQPSSNHIEQKSYAGDVQARQQTALAFRVGGQITERFVDVGDRVRVGQVLAKLDVKDAQLQLNAAKAQLDSAQAAAKIAAQEYQRYQQLLPVNAVSRSQFDAIKNQYEAAQASLQQARSNYEVSSNQTGYNQLISNKNGVITERQIEVGQVVAAGQAAYLLAIDGEREVVFGVPNKQSQRLKWGSLLGSHCGLSQTFALQLKYERFLLLLINLEHLRSRFPYWKVNLAFSWDKVRVYSLLQIKPMSSASHSLV